MSAIEILKKDKEINTDELDISELVDIRDVKIDSKKPYLIRMISYINQVKHPYCYCVGNVRVRVSYAGKEKTLIINIQFKGVAGMRRFFIDRGCINYFKKTTVGN